MVEDEGAKDCKVGNLDLSQGTTARSDITGVITWDTKLEITRSSEIKRRLLQQQYKIAIQKKVMMFFW